MHSEIGSPSQYGRKHRAARNNPTAIPTEASLLPRAEIRGPRRLRQTGCRRDAAAKGLKARIRGILFPADQICSLLAPKLQRHPDVVDQRWYELPALGGARGF